MSITLPSGVELFTRISSGSAANAARKTKELNAAADFFEGIRFGMGTTAEIFADPNSPVWTEFDIVVAGCLARPSRVSGLPLKLSLQLLGEGVPVNTAWRAYNSTTSWTYTRRPPPGPGRMLWSKMADLQSLAIARAWTAYDTAGYDPYEFITLESGNEPGLGGSGASGLGYVGATNGSPWDALPEGHWDGTADLASTSARSNYLEMFNYLCSNTNFKGLKVIAPCFEGQSTASLAKELATFDAAPFDWISRMYGWAINMKPTAQTQGPSMGRERFGRIVETQCEAVMTTLRAQPRIGQMPIYWVEAGVSSVTAGQEGDLGRPRNHRHRGRLIQELLEGIGALGVARVCLYTMSDTSSSSAADQFGLYDDAMAPYSALYQLYEDADIVEEAPTGSYTVGATETALSV